MVEHQSDVTEVEYPNRDELPTSAPRDSGEVMDIVVRKGPISLRDMMNNQIFSMSRDKVYRALAALQEADYVDNFDGDLEQHGTTELLWYVPVDND